MTDFNKYLYQLVVLFGIWAITGAVTTVYIDGKITSYIILLI